MQRTERPFPSWRWHPSSLLSRRGFWPIFAMVLILIVDGIVSPSFFSITLVNGRLYGSIIDVVYRGTPTALVALGMAVVIGTAGIDISVGAVIAIAGAVMTGLIHGGYPAMVVLLVALGVGLACGVWNGLLVSRLHIQPMIATLILMVAGRGMAQMINGGRVVTFRNEFFSAISTGQFLTIPSRIIVLAVVLALMYLLIRRTALGLFVETVGGNASAAALAGIDPRLVTLLVYAICGLCAAVAGVLITADVRGSDPNNAGLWIEMDAILAVVLGGGSLMGGRVYLGMTLVGVMIMQLLTTSMLVAGMPPEYNMIMKAVLVLLVLLLQARNMRKLFADLLARGRS